MLKSAQLKRRTSLYYYILENKEGKVGKVYSLFIYLFFISKAVHFFQVTTCQQMKEMKSLKKHKKK